MTPEDLVHLRRARDTLGLQVRTEMNFEGMRWLTVGPTSQPDIEIVLESPDMRAPADQEPLKALLAKGALSTVIFVTDDCNATFEQLRAAGAEVLQEPIDQPYGVRDCAFRDPSGNRSVSPSAAPADLGRRNSQVPAPCTHAGWGRRGRAWS